MAKEIKDRITRIKNGSAPGPDGIRKNLIVNKAAQETLRLFYNHSWSKLESSKYDSCLTWWGAHVVQ